MDQPDSARDAPQRISEQLERWREQPGKKTLGGLIDTAEEKSFALIFALLLGVPALPLPTGGVTHVLEAVAMLLALQLIAGRDSIWIPERWREVELDGGRKAGFVDGLIRTAKRLEKHTRPRLTFLFDRRLSDVVFGLVALGGSLAAFLAPPFTGLDTLPALGVVVVSVAVVVEDAIVAAAGLVVLACGIALEIALGGAVVKGVESLF